MMCGVGKLPCIVMVCMIWLQPRHNIIFAAMMSSRKSLHLLTRPDEMYTKWKLCTWTSIELRDKYVSYGGQLTWNQMFTKMVMHLGDDLMVLCIGGCSSIVGFQEFVGKLLKVSKVNTVDEEKRNDNRISTASSWNHRDWQTLSLASGHSYFLASCPSWPSLWEITGPFHLSTILALRKYYPLWCPLSRPLRSATKMCVLVIANEKDTQWLNSLCEGQDAMEWNVFNN